MTWVEELMHAMHVVYCCLNMAIALLSCETGHSNVLTLMTFFRRIFPLEGRARGFLLCGRIRWAFFRVAITEIACLMMYFIVINLTYIPKLMRVSPLFSLWKTISLLLTKIYFQVLFFHMRGFC